MGAHPRVLRTQAILDILTRKWWLYPLLLLLLFIPPYTSQGYDPRRTIDLVGEVLSGPLSNALPPLMPVAKILPLALVAGVFLYGNRMRRPFNVYMATLYMALALFQTTAVTPTFGLVVISGNLALVLVVALSWIWEVAAESNDFGPAEHQLWRWWVAPLALVALLEPVDVATMSPDFSPVRLMTNEAGLSYCMMTPLVLATLTLFHPRINLAVLRVNSFVGIAFGTINMIVWFGLETWGWWMGVLHIPLLVLSLYAFLLAHGRGQQEVPRVASLPPEG